MWSSPVARLLGGRLRRRLIKLDNKSPPIAVAPISAPSHQAISIRGAIAAVAAIETRTPRTVLVGPNTGRRSRKSRPASSGCAGVRPQAFLASTGAPFATASSNSSFSRCGNASGSIAPSPVASPPCLESPGRLPAQEQAAVDVDRLPGDVASFRSGQESHHRGDLLGPALPPERDAACDAARPCGPPAEGPRTVSIEPGATQLAV